MYMEGVLDGLDVVFYQPLDEGYVTLGKALSI